MESTNGGYVKQSVDQNSSVSSICVSRSDGGWRSLCFKISYSEPTGAESREGTSILAESCRVFLGDVILNSD